ncbi:MAG TPA: glycosyltransferase family 4 protein [Fibrobacteria bacterium]|nr:glycosyltransferase family 4 protein [Fibrobacteria bacterium]
MKILMAASCPSDPNLGVPGVMHSLARQWRDLGHEVRMRFRDRPGRVGEILFGTRLACCADARWADVVDCHAVEAWPLVWTPGRAVVVARSHGLEIGVHRRLVESRDRGEARISRIYWTYRGSVRLFQERRSIRSADLSLLLNQRDFEVCRDEFRADPSRLHLVRNGFPSEFLEVPLERVEPSLLFVGSWIERKGCDLLAKSLGRILEAVPGLKVRLAGTGIPDDQVRADFPGEIGDRLEIVGRFRRDQLPSLARDRPILLFPSRSEGAPLSLIECMALGTVPVASSIPGVVELVRDGRDGLLFPSGDVDAFVAKVVDLAKNPARLDAMRLAARDRVRDFSWQTVARDQIDLFSKALVAKGRSR